MLIFVVLCVMKRHVYMFCATSGLPYIYVHLVNVDPSAQMLMLASDSKSSGATIEIRESLTLPANSLWDKGNRGHGNFCL